MAVVKHSWKDEKNKKKMCERPTNVVRIQASSFSNGVHARKQSLQDSLF